MTDFNFGNCARTFTTKLAVFCNKGGLHVAGHVVVRVDWVLGRAFYLIHGEELARFASPRQRLIFFLFLLNLLHFFLFFFLLFGRIVVEGSQIVRKLLQSIYHFSFGYEFLPPINFTPVRFFNFEL